MDEVKLISSTEKNLDFMLFGIHPEEYDRDLDLVKKYYFEVLKQGELPKFSDIREKVCEYNADICDKIAEEYYEENFSKQILTEICRRNNCLPEDLTEKQIQEARENMIRSMGINLFNDINMSISFDSIGRENAIESCIHTALSELNYEYEDDSFHNPLFHDLSWNFKEYRILRNNPQLVMFPEIFKEQYDKVKRSIDYVLQEGMVIKRRPPKKVKLE